MTRFDPAEWAADLYRAAEERGWHVTSIDMRGSVVLEDHKAATTLEIRGIFTSGDYLRSILAPKPEPQP